MDSDEAAVRERELDRLLTFVDAAIAIALTLLVLPLVELPAELNDGETVANLFRDYSAEFWSFLLSFWVVAQLWLAQHRAMRRVRRSHHTLTVILLLWTLTIVFLPFPTALLPVAGDQAMTKTLYIGTMVVSVLLIGAASLVVERNPELVDLAADHHVGVGGAVSMALLLLLALAITLVFPATSYYPLLLLFFGGPLAIQIERHRHRVS